MLREYQQRAMENAFEFLSSAEPGARRLYVSPCGTGKSYIQVGLQSVLQDLYIVTPRTEIIDGMVKKGGDASRIFTPVTLRNRLLDGSVRVPKYLICDEVHHDTASVAQTIRLCCGDSPTVGFTATPFRGTPQGTVALKALYGEPHYILTLKAAIEQGYASLPKCRTVPILDDDLVEITNGEFAIRTIEKRTPWTAAASLVHEMWQTPVPTVVSLPSVSSVATLAEILDRLGIPNVSVTGETKTPMRVRAFNDCISGQAVLLQVQVVSEGVDLPIRRLIDFAPTMSPVRWLQQVGRAMRPGGESEYICTNRNLLRHGYLLEGLVPSEAFGEAQSAFPTHSKRDSVRAFGLEGVGRLKPCRVPLANGLVASAYYVTRSTAHVATQYVAIVLPNTPQPLWAERTNGATWGKWTRCDPPSELQGFASVPPRPLSLKQSAWWKKSARHFGLDHEAEVDAKTFAVLPVLCDLKMRIT